MVKVAVYLTAFYLVYSLVLSRDTSYGRNRAFILISLASAIIFPFITFQTIKPLDIQFFGKFLEEVFITASPEKTFNINPGLSASESLQIFYTIYIIGIIIYLFKLVIDLFNLMLLILRGKNTGSRIIRFHGFNTSGFSAMGYIFINTRLSPEEAGEIIRHEQNHLRQNHFLDIIFIEIVKAFQWFNPVIYLLNNALRAIHEYQADQDCLSAGIPVANYQSLLLNQVFKSRAFSLTNSFSNPSLIKRRMIMMTKKRTSSAASMKLLLVIPVTVIVSLAISAYKEIPVSKTSSQIIQASSSSSELAKTSDISSVPESRTVSTSTKRESPAPTGKVTNNIPAQTNTVAPPPPPPPPPSESENQGAISEEEKEEAPFVVVEVMPMFPGGDVELLKFISEHTNYPENAKTNSIQGRVIVRFCVTAKGGVSQASVLKGVSPELDEEALRVVNILPTFRPGAQGGKNVPVWYMVPITFTLK